MAQVRGLRRRRNGLPLAQFRYFGYRSDSEFFVELPPSDSCPDYRITAGEIRPNMQKYFLDVLPEMC